MNRAFSFSLVAILLVALLASFSCSDEKSDNGILMYGGAPSGLIIREKPSTDGVRKGIVPFGMQVEVLEQQEQNLTIQGKSGRWSRIRYQGTEGWVFGGFLLANAPAREADKAEDTSKAPTVTSLQLGDHACYVTLKFADGKEQDWPASFDICELPLLNKKVIYKTEKSSMAADSCEGDPECTETQEVEMITSMKAAQ